MLKTPEKILEKALDLFNQQGWEQVSIRQIARELGISHGNLCYHFANTQAIAEKLFDQMKIELSENQITNEFAFDLEHLFQYFRQNFQIRYKYKFLILNLHDLIQQIPGLSEQYKYLDKLMEQEFRRQFAELQKEGICKSSIPQVLVENLIISHGLLENFWISHAEIFYKGKKEVELDYYLFQSINLIWPFLSPKGMEIYRQHRFFSKYLKF
jgi:AcrR family transcriptional regulator